MKSKDVIKMLKHLNITPQQAQSLLNAKLTTSNRLTKYLKEVVTSPPTEKAKPKKEKKKKEEKPTPATRRIGLSSSTVPQSTAVH
jgi:hypothetical protein